MDHSVIVSGAFRIFPTQPLSDGVAQRAHVVEVVQGWPYNAPRGEHLKLITLLVAAGEERSGCHCSLPVRHLITRVIVHNSLRALASALRNDPYNSRRACRHSATAARLSPRHSMM